MDCRGQGSDIKVMTSFWSMWKMFCDFQTKMKVDNEQSVVAIIPDDPDILGDVRMGGYKHQFEVVSHSCAFGNPMPDGRMLSEKIVLRSRKIRVQDFHVNSRKGHVHTSRCGVRRLGYTGLGSIMQTIAWELDVLRIIASNNRFEENRPNKCAFAVRMKFAPRQPRHSSFSRCRDALHVSAEVDEGQLDITCLTKVLNHGARVHSCISGSIVSRQS